MKLLQELALGTKKGTPTGQFLIFDFGATIKTRLPFPFINLKEKLIFAGSAVGAKIFVIAGS
ncbi:MAG: hypothetical protein US85_C0023G0001 [Candidatus Shapirobacteria bacterium GW2011_GWF1_38_23]|nr:MAG: hypothetical protein US85_C0023G0001 [Candidatus Shapirobacteria bacterium GW2011_GWF1_38_23]